MCPETAVADRELRHTRGIRIGSYRSRCPARVVTEIRLSDIAEGFASEAIDVSVLKWLARRELWEYAERR